MALLELREVGKVFGGVTAVDGISFALEEGVIKALIGPNGAGKTTILNLITGFYTPTSGQIFFMGHGITREPTHRVARRGLSRTFQNVRLFENMTVLENVMVGCHLVTRSGALAGALALPWMRREEERARSRAREMLAFVNLESQAHLMCGSLSFGQQRMLEIARVLAAEPRCVCLDEPAAGLNSVERQELSELITRIRSLGITVLLVEHDMDLVMNISDEVLVLDYGRKLAEGTPEEIQTDERVIAAYLGEEHNGLRPGPAALAGGETTEA